jgi:hypothetical protein
VQWRVRMCTWGVLRRRERLRGGECLHAVFDRAILHGRRKCANTVRCGVLRFRDWAHHRSVLRAVHLYRRNILYPFKYKYFFDVCRVSHGGLLFGGRQHCRPVPAGDVRHEPRAPKRVLQRAVPAGYVQQWRWDGRRECLHCVPPGPLWEHVGAHQQRLQWRLRDPRRELLLSCWYDSCCWHAL